MAVCEQLWKGEEAAGMIPSHTLLTIPATGQAAPIV